MAKMTHRLMPPGDGNHGTVTVNGRKYTCALGATIDVPDADAYVLMANGWTTASAGGAGTTAARPINPTPGSEFHDTALGYTIKWDGKAWRNASTGAAV
jgi:hypothetical protein